MGISQIFGLALLVVGTLLLYFGFAASRGVGEQIHETFTGRFTKSTVGYFVLGAAAAIVGLGLLGFGGPS
jgi:hypothetical protein